MYEFEHSIRTTISNGNVHYVVESEVNPSLHCSRMLISLLCLTCRNRNGGGPYIWCDLFEE